MYEQYHLWLRDRDRVIPSSVQGRDFEHAAQPAVNKRLLGTSISVLGAVAQKARWVLERRHPHQTLRMTT